MIPASVVRGKPASLKGTVVVFVCRPGTIDSGRCHLWNGLPEFSGAWWEPGVVEVKREHQRWMWLAHGKQRWSSHSIVWPDRSLAAVDWSDVIGHLIQVLTWTRDKSLSEWRCDLHHLTKDLCLLVQFLGLSQLPDPDLCMEGKSGFTSQCRGRILLHCLIYIYIC